MTDFTFSTHGDRIAYDRYGPAGDGDGSVPAVVFVAGAGPFRAGDPVTSETARLVAADGVSTVVFDRLGRGESEASGVLGLGRELAAIEAAIAATGQGSAVLCGHSSGCSLALAAAAGGLSVDGLALWEIPTSDSAEATTAWSDEFERLLDADEAEAAQLQYMRDMPPEFLEAARSSPAWPAIVANARSLRADGQSLVWATRAIESGGLAAIARPVLLMYGTETFPVMPLAADRVAAEVHGAEVKEVAGAMHSWEPAAMAAELSAFARGRARR